LLGTHFSVFSTGLLYLYDRPDIGVPVILTVMASLYTSLVQQPEVTRLFWRQQGGWLISSDRDETDGLILVSGSRFSSLFCVLHFRACNGRRVDLMVFADSVDTDTYKKLLVLLHSGEGVNGSAGTP
jgi:hypothetical protein